MGVLLLIGISYVALYFLIKSAVKNGIIEARKADGEKYVNSSSQISQTKCTQCGVMHDIDYVRCPNCGYKAE